MTDYCATNRALWDGWAELHEHSKFYDVDAFRVGKLTLKPIEREEVGDVSGLTLLHLQCHFGLDTMSWARLGAQVTGVDFSERAIALARSIAAETAITARFLCGNVYDLPAELSDAFDIVFTSYGVLAWLPDLSRWAQTIARCLRPGGRFHIVEFHPLSGVLDDTGRSLVHPYFRQPEPQRFEVQGSYAEPTAGFRHESFEWSHSVADILNALISAGLSLRWFREYPFSPYNCFPFGEEREPGRWYVRGTGPDLPLLFSLCAVRAPLPAAVTG